MRGQVGDGQDGLSSSIEFDKFIATPRLSLWIVVLEVTDGAVWVVSFFDVALVSSVHIVVEGVFEGKRVKLVVGSVFNN